MDGRTTSPARLRANERLDCAVRTLREVEGELKQQEEASRACQQRIAELKEKKMLAEESIQQSRQATLAPVRPRRIMTAYALWLFLPFVWPGAYLFYLGRDAHCLLHTSTFGGFGVGWLLDALFIPMYVADHNEPPGYLEVASRRLRRWWAPAYVLTAPFSLVLQLAVGLYFGVICANLVPWEQLPDMIDIDPLSRGNTNTASLCIGMLAMASAVRLACTVLGRARCTCRWRPLLYWTVPFTAIVVALLSEEKGKPERDQVLIPGLVLGSIGVMIGAAHGRTPALSNSPRQCTSRRLGPRLLLQLVCVGAVAGAATGAFCFNGSYTHTDDQTGQTTTYSGAEALGMGWAKVCEFSSDFSTQAHILWRQQDGKTWSQMWSDVLDAFADPKNEAASVLEISKDASSAEVTKAHRRLARQCHPDKMGPDASVEQQAEAERKMQRLNWAKEVLLGKH